MQSALDLFRQMTPAVPPRIEVVAEPDLPPILETFFSPNVPVIGNPITNDTRLPLPSVLQPFALVYRLADTGALPADKCAEVIAAVSDAADRKGLRLADRLEELAELDAWSEEFMRAGIERADPDPFDE